MLALRFLGSLYPLLKDIFLEGKSLKEAANDSKRKLLILAGVLLSIILNFYLIPRILSLSAHIVVLEKKLKQDLECHIDEKNTQTNQYDKYNFYLDQLQKNKESRP